MLGTLVGFHQALIGRAKRQWLIHHYRAERIRQFHFQLIVNNLERAAAALDGGAALDAWRTFRQRKLDDFVHDAEKTLAIAFDALEDDHAEEEVWADRAWSEPPPTPLQTPELAELLKGLEEQRIGVQERYTALKLKPGLYSPETRAQWLHSVSGAFTAVILLITVAIGALYVRGSEEPRLWLLGLLGLAGALTAAVVALRVLNEGLLLRTEAERYRWYLASVRSAARRFQKADAADHIRLARELERIAYQEMRRFLVTFKGRGSSCERARLEVHAARRSPRNPRSVSSAFDDSRNARYAAGSGHSLAMPVGPESAHYGHSSRRIECRESTLSGHCGARRWRSLLGGTPHQ